MMRMRRIVRVAYQVDRLQHMLHGGGRNTATSDVAVLPFARRITTRKHQANTANLEFIGSQ